VQFKRNLQEAGIDWKFYKNAECVASAVVDSKAFKNGAWKDINLIIMFLAVMTSRNERGESSNGRFQMKL
jgi:hypothetical protein